jgi:hypothetical protein
VIGRMFTVAVVMVALGTGPSAALMAAVGGAATPDPGMTSPLGTLDPTSPAGGSGIPLGSTALSFGGLSPAPIDPNGGATTCAGPTMSGAPPAAPSPASPSNVFDGGGATSVTVNPALSIGCNSPPGFPVLSGMSSVPGAAMVAPPATASGGSIPLGATEAGSVGLSGPIAVPVPSASPTYCPGLGGILTGITPGLGSGSPTAGAIPSPGTSLPFGC